MEASSLVTILPLLCELLTIGSLARLMRVCREVRSFLLHQDNRGLFQQIARQMFGWKLWRNADFNSLCDSIRSTKRCHECGLAGSSVVECELVSGHAARYCKVCTQIRGGYRRLVRQTAVQRLILALKWRPKSPAKILKLCRIVRTSQHNAYMYWAHEVIDQFNRRRVAVGIDAISRGSL